MAGEITTIARPYAEAIFASAQASGTLEAWGQQLALLSAIVADEAMAKQIATPRVSRARLRDLILDLAGSELSQEARNLVRLLAENKRLFAVPEIARLFEAFYRRQRQLRAVQIRTAYPVDAAQQKKLAEVLKKRLAAEVELTMETDPSLIGGIEIRAGDLVIDASLRGKLEKLAGELGI